MESEKRLADASPKVLYTCPYIAEYGKEYHIRKYLPKHHGAAMPDVRGIYGRADTNDRTGPIDALQMRGERMQMTFQIWCDCGILMEAYTDGKYKCQGCCKVFDASSVPVNKNNGQLTGKEVLDLLSLLEDHHHEAGGPDDEPFCYVGCTCEACWPDED